MKDWLEKEKKAWINFSTEAGSRCTILDNHRSLQYGAIQVDSQKSNHQFKKAIIATDNGRDEFEVIQHGSIKNLDKMSLTKP